MKQLYAKILNADNSIDEERRMENFDAAAVAHKFGPDKEYRIIPIERLADPVGFDPATHRLSGQTEVVEPTRVTRVRNVVAIPQAELDDNAELDQVKTGIATLQSAITAIQNGTGDAIGVKASRMENTIIKLCRAVIRMAKDQYGE
jgi:hypothetical protein